MFTISKDFAFSAAHRLDHLPPDHKCYRLHGHNYLVRVEVTSPQLDHRGFVVDYAELDPIGDWINTQFDHKYLNENTDLALTTAEYLAATIYEIAVDVLAWASHATVTAVGVSETPKTWVWFRDLPSERKFTEGA
jgi:6-pyruvoyltetrahydropterin/6-carboxytetrahydropterin synthase